MKIKIKCQKCFGDGWYVGTIQNCFYDSDGSMCFEPEPCQIQCEECYGEGYHEVEETDC